MRRIEGTAQSRQGDDMGEKYKQDRRDFLKQAAGAIGVAAQTGHWSSPAALQIGPEHKQPDLPRKETDYPRQFQGRQLRMISFPLGGIAAGSIGLGGRGQLRDWEIFNRPNIGFRPPYAFPSIWARAGAGKPVARVLESRILPPYDGSSGLGSDDAPGLSRLESATFTGQYPLAHIKFQDPCL
jgi:hypothetical protein